MYPDKTEDTQGVVKMSRPRYYWFGIVKTIIYQYPNKLDRGTIKGAEADICIKKALNETSAAKDGEERMRLIDMVFVRKTHKVYGAASEIHISESTAKRWIAEFVYLVAQNMGYL